MTEEAMTGRTSEAFLTELDAELGRSVDRLKASAFLRSLSGGDNVRALYVAYLREAYHFVRLTSSFTPLAARRMDLRFIKLRKWVLTHSAEELGHELMALHDLQILGFPKEETERSAPGPGTMAWVSFFHYHVTMAHPFAAMGVLYFLEGMASQLASSAVKNVLGALGNDEKRAVTFFREHGVLDVDHLAEQRELLARDATDREAQDAVIRTVMLGGHVMRFFLDALVEGVR